jgi:hypothetical protein
MQSLYSNVDYSQQHESALQRLPVESYCHFMKDHGVLEIVDLGCGDKRIGTTLQKELQHPFVYIDPVRKYKPDFLYYQDYCACHMPGPWIVYSLAIPE